MSVLSTASSRALIKILSRIGPRLDPCGSFLAGQDLGPHDCTVTTATAATHYHALSQLSLVSEEQMLENIALLGPPSTCIKKFSRTPSEILTACVLP